MSTYNPSQANTQHIHTATTNTTYDCNTKATDAAQALSSAIAGKSVLITGCSPRGIGEATAQALAAAGVGNLTLSGRSKIKIDTVATALAAAYPKVKIRTLIMDLASLKSVRAAAVEVNAYPEAIDVLINNGGAMALEKHELTDEGIEMMFAVNHVGHFLFTNLIMGKLRSAVGSSKTPGATRVVNLSSLGHRYGPIRFSDINFTGKEVPTEEQPNWELVKWRGGTDTLDYQPMVAYAQSKTANILFTVGLNRRLFKDGIVSLAVHPGAVASEGATRHVTNATEEMRKSFTWKTLDQGASTSVVAAFDPKLDGRTGVYLSDCQVEEAVPWATNEALAERLWKLSEELVGEKFDV